MTKINVYRKNGDIVKFIISGHTGFKKAGEDIVCSAISTLGYSTINGLTDVVGLTIGYEVKDGYLECVLPETLTEENRMKADVLLKTLVLSLKNLEEQYREYITITELEV